MAASPQVESAAQGARNSAALSFLRKPKLLLIDGKWVPAKSGKTFETINPTNEEVLARIAEGDKADVDEAVKAARKAFDEGPWPGMNPHQRARLMFKIAELIDEHADELAEIETLDNGKPLTFSRGFDIPAAAETFRYYGGWRDQPVRSVLF
jgi:acyl-CoA reductase-like NAD-dependent aldehyde dehydrogenase